MTRFIRGLMLGAALLCLCASARAQTVYGPGGLFVHPSAFTPRQGQVGLNASWLTQDGGVRQEWTPVSVTYAVTDQAQIGVLHINRAYAGNGHSTRGLFGKYQIVPDSPNRPAVAIAATLLDADIEQYSVSGVASHDFMRNGRRMATGHVGVQWARRQDIADPKQDASLFVGAVVPIAQAWSLVGEYGTKFRFNKEAASAFGISWVGRDGLSLGVGWVNTGRSDDNRFFVGIGYSLGGGRRSRW